MNQPVQILEWTPTKVDADKGRWLLDSNDFRFPSGFVVAQSAVMAFQPGGWAANHRHDKREVLLAMDGELYLVWRDGDGRRQERAMLSGNDNLLAFVIASSVPHLVENRSNTNSATLYEWSDGTDAATALVGAESLR